MMRRGFILISTLAFLPACAPEDQPPPFEPQMAAVKGPVFQVIRYDSVDRRGAYVYPTSYANGGFSWEEANAIAQQMKYRGRRGHLADFDDQADERAIIAAFDLPIAPFGCWIGLVQDPAATAVNQGWRWQMGGAPTYSSWWPGNGSTTAYPCDSYCYNKQELHRADYVVVRLEDADDGQGCQPYWRDEGAGAHYACAIVELDR